MDGITEIPNGSFHAIVVDAVIHDQPIPVAAHSERGFLERDGAQAFQDVPSFTFATECVIENTDCTVHTSHSESRPVWRHFHYRVPESGVGHVRTVLRPLITRKVIHTEFTGRFAFNI